MMADAIRLMLFPAVMAFAASSDLLTMTISNRVSLILVGGFFALAFVIGMNPTAILSHLGAAGLVLVVAFVFFAQGWIGGGDAKLAAATALWLGFDHLVPYLIYASLFGGLLTLVLLQLRTMPLPGLLAGQPWAAAPAPQGLRRPLRHRARGGRPRRLSRHDLDAGDRRLTSPAPSRPLQAHAPASLAASTGAAAAARAATCAPNPSRLRDQPDINSISIPLINHALTFSC